MTDTLRRNDGKVDVSDDDEYKSTKAALSQSDLLATYRENSGLIPAQIGLLFLSKHHQKERSAPHRYVQVDDRDSSILRPIR